MNFTLQQLGLLDAPEEEKFDKLTSLASDLLQVPVAHVSIADHTAKRIFYKSQYGHPVELADLRQLPMELTYCQHVALTKAPVIVRDAREHPLLKGTPALTEEQPLAYLGVPIHAPGNRVVGGLCMMQPEPRHWDDDEISKATILASCVSDLIELKAAMLTSEQLRREQQQFTYAISHDLRSPVNTLQMVLDEVAFEGDRLSTGTQSLIHQGLATAKRIGKQFEDVLAYSRTIDLGGADERVALEDLFEEIMLDLHCEILASKAKIVCAEMPEIIGNRMQLRALFQNLVSNSIKYKAPDRNPVVTISALTDERLGEHHVTIADNGIGIAPNDQKKIFELFSRLHLRNQYAGTGVGLSLCQRVAANHQGAITVSSDGKNGAAFTVQIPVHRS